VIRARAVTKRFGDLVAVDRVDLHVGAGEVVGLLGANGAGKTTLLRVVLGLIRATSGDVRLFGQPPSRATRRRIGYVPQGLGLYEDLTVRENLAFVAAAFGARAVVPGDPGLRVALDTVVRDLPLGLRRRAAFAAALTHRPELLVLDEPTSGVDPLGRTQLWDTVRDAADGGAGVVVTTHHMDEARQCDRLVVMAAGRVVAAGTLAEIVGGATAVEVATDEWRDAFTALDRAGLAVSLRGRRLRVSGEDPREVAAALEGAGIDAEVRSVAATFDERFVSLTLEADRSSGGGRVAG
jgi:ABC-2 type transport system ATP-binding protein